ncbi:MAG: RsmE family RNA methyltransferase [Chloroflexota bacterium]|nr:RsmE family RNA methyltransferase [Chloroflexota bacterium]
MMRIYLTKEISEEIIIENTKVNKIRNVLRMSKGDEIEVFNGKGVSYITKINSISSKKIVLNFVKYLSQNLYFSKPKIHLAISMVKPSRFEIAIEKTTEIGVDNILPVVTKNTNKIYTKINSNRLKRWENIAISAAEQCGTNVIPKFSSLTDIYKLSKDFSDSKTLKIFFNENNNNLKKNINEISSYSNVLILIGPEGGFSNDEIEFLEKNKFTSQSLGENILRTETAAICSVFNIHSLL